MTEIYQEARRAVLSEGLRDSRAALEYLGLVTPGTEPEWNKMAGELTEEPPKLLGKDLTQYSPVVTNKLKENIQKANKIAGHMQTTADEQEKNSSVGGATWGQIGKAFSNDFWGFLSALFSALFAWIGNGFQGFGEIFKKALGPMIAPIVAEDAGAKLKKTLEDDKELDLTPDQRDRIVYAFKSKVREKGGAQALPPLGAAAGSGNANTNPASVSSPAGTISPGENLKNIFDGIVQQTVPEAVLSMADEATRQTFTKAKKAFRDEGTKLAQNPEWQNKDASVFAEEVIRVTRIKLTDEKIIDPNKEDAAITSLLNNLKKNIVAQHSSIIAAARGAQVTLTPTTPKTHEEKCAEILPSVTQDVNKRWDKMLSNMSEETRKLMNTVMDANAVRADIITAVTEFVADGHMSEKIDITMRRAAIQGKIEGVLQKAIPDSRGDIAVNPGGTKGVFAEGLITPQNVRNTIALLVANEMTGGPAMSEPEIKAKLDPYIRPTLLTDICSVIVPPVGIGRLVARAFGY